MNYNFHNIKITRGFLKKIRPLHVRKYEKLLNPVEHLEFDKNEDLLMEMKDENGKKYFLRKKRKCAEKQENLSAFDDFNAEFKEILEHVRNGTQSQFTQKGFQVIEDSDNTLNFLFPCDKTFESSLLNDVIKIDEVESDESDTVSEDSPLWALMECYCDEDTFNSTPPGYNMYYDAEESHPLDNPRVHWKKIDRSNIKCKKWLNEQCD